MIHCTLYIYFNNIITCIFPAKGRASTDSAGILVAIAQQASKLEPQSKLPVIVFENDNKSCIIQRSGTITAAVYKNI